MGVTSAGATPVLEGLDEAQHAAVTCEATAVGVIAPPGSGKTRVLTRRAAWRVSMGDDPRRMLVVTFTRRAAAEVASRLRALGVQGATVGTMHAVALAQLHRRAEDRGRRPPRVLGSPSEALGELEPESPPARRDELARLWSWAGSQGLAADDLRHRPPPGWGDDEVELAVASVRAYERWKRRRGVLDFHDLLRAWQVAVDDDPVFGAAQRWRLADVLVDEFQDVNPTQAAALDALSGPESTLFVVGDPHQAIYGFNGADPAALDSLSVRRPEVVTVRLGVTYRCPQAIVDAAARGLTIDPPRSAVGPGRPPGAWSAPDADAEAAGIVGLVEDARARGLELSDVVVLARTRALVADLGRRLSARGLATAKTPEPGSPAVLVTTIHAAKGLEWPVVVVAGADADHLPHPSARTPDAVAEERRLLYVALTRASESVHITWAEHRPGDPPGSVRPRSPLLDELELDSPSSGAALAGGAVIEPAGSVAPSRAAWRAELDQARSALDGDATNVHERVAAVRRWRARRAAAGWCAPESVLGDPQVRLLAGAPPCDVDELSARLGWGPAAADRHGASLLAALDSCDTAGAEGTEADPPASGQRSA